MSPEIAILLMNIIFIGCIFTGYPIAFVLGAAGIGFGLLEWGWLSYNIFAMQVFGVMNNTVLMAIPLFILMANFLVHSGVAKRLFATTPYFFGPLNGGMGVGVILVSTLMAACTGIVGAAVTSMGLTALPVMLESKYDKTFSLGIVAAGGTLGILIPPSILLVVIAPYASISAGKVFAGAMIPGLILAFFYVLYTFIICWIFPKKGPALSIEQRSAVSMNQRVSLILRNVAPTLLLILGVLGSIFFGWATVTEAAAVGAFISFLLVIVYRNLSWQTIKDVLMATAKTSTMVMICLVAAACFTTTLFGLGGKTIVSDWMLSFNLSSWGLMAMILLIVFALGFIMDWVEIVPIVFPIFLPIITAAGFDPLWFCIIIALILQSAFMTPPVGASLFYLKGVAPDNCTMMDIVIGIIPFSFIVVIIVVLSTIFPQLITWLPGVMIR